MWDIYKAKAWMLRTGMDHIRDGLSLEGGDLIYESKWGDGCHSRKQFIQTVKSICCWDDDMIEDTIKEIQNEVDFKQ
jgi:hypothetical protein